MKHSYYLRHGFLEQKNGGFIFFFFFSHKIKALVSLELGVEEPSLVTSLKRSHRPLNPSSLSLPNKGSTCTFVITKSDQY